MAHPSALARTLVETVRVTSTMDQIRVDVESCLVRRRGTRGTFVRWAEDHAKRGGAKVFAAFRKRPTVGALLLSTAGVALATVLGPGELAIGMGLGLAGYKVFRRGETAEQALDEVEHGMR